MQFTYAMWAAIAQGAEILYSKKGYCGKRDSTGLYYTNKGAGGITRRPFAGNKSNFYLQAYFSSVQVSLLPLMV